MERGNNSEIYNSSNNKKSLNKLVAGAVFATSIVVTGVLLKNNNSTDIDLSFTEEQIVHQDTQSSKKVSSKNLSQEILSEYEKRKNENKLKNVEIETKDWIDKLLSKLGFNNKNEIHDKQNVDFYLLAKTSKEYIESHKVSIVGDNAGKAFLITYFQKEKKGKGEIIYLPIPSLNPNSSTLKVTKSGISFSITPTPKSNGYNTEYNITTDVEGKTYQLSILYPIENSDYTKISNRKITLESKKSDLEKKESDLKLSEKGKKKKDTSKHKVFQEQIKEVNLAIKELEKTLRVTKKFNYFSYIPYTKLQDNEKARKNGFSYLLQTMHESYNSKFGRKVSSYNSAIAGLSLGEAIPESFPLVLNIIERMDYLEYFEKDLYTLKDKKTLNSIMGVQINRALTTLGLNGKDAFNWQKSPVGAIGIGQIMPGTYNLFRSHEKYKSLFPQEDFSKAAKDHKTTFRLQIAHFDDQIFQLPKQIRDNWTTLLSSNDTKVGLNSVLAAGYNGSMKRVVGEVFGNIPQDSSIEHYKKSLNPEVIMTNMKKQKDLKVAKLESEISILRESLKKKGIKKSQIDLINTKIKEKQDLIIQINNTYKESVTYVLKTEFVIHFLQSKYPKEMSQI